jgi:TetR/AcrR family transcriptional regulator
MKKKSFERKKELLDAALNEFTMKNYENASLNTIIKNAGISKGTFYYHFQDKQALYLYLLENANKTKWEFMNRQIKENNTDLEVKDIFEGFKIQAQLGMKFANLFPKYHRLSLMFDKEKGNQIYEDAKSSLGVTTEAIMDEMVEKAIKNGDFDQKFSQEFIVKVMSFLFLNFDEIFGTEEDFKLETMVQNLNNYVDFMKNGLGNSRRS